jgi:DNA-binding NarL/FixJ family response regulator
MSIKILIADDSDVMRNAMRKLIEEESRIEIIGETSSFVQTMQAIADFRPEVILFDLHMAEKHDFAPALVKSQLLAVDHVLAVSFSNGAEAKDLAESYGARLLLDKMKLFSELVPAILECGPKVDYFNCSNVTSDRLQAD